MSRIRERLTEPQRELAHRVGSAQRLVQRVLEPDVGRGDDRRIEFPAT
jgi:hypothetical protein